MSDAAVSSTPQRTRPRIASDLRVRVHERQIHSFIPNAASAAATKQSAKIEQHSSDDLRASIGNEDSFGSAFDEMWTYSPTTPKSSSAVGTPKSKALTPLNAHHNEKPSGLFLQGGTPIMKTVPVASPAKQISLPVPVMLSQMAVDLKPMKSPPPLPAIESPSPKNAPTALAKPESAQGFVAVNERPQFFRSDLADPHEKSPKKPLANRTNWSTFPPLQSNTLHSRSPSPEQQTTHGAKPSLLITDPTKGIKAKLSNKSSKERLSSLREKTLQYAEEARDYQLDNQVKDREELNRGIPMIPMDFARRMHQDTDNSLSTTQDQSFGFLDQYPEFGGDDETFNSYPLEEIESASQTNLRIESIAPVASQKLFARERRPGTNSSSKLLSMREINKSHSTHSPLELTSGSHDSSRPASSMSHDDIQDLTQQAISIIRAANSNSVASTARRAESANHQQAAKAIEEMPEEASQMPQSFATPASNMPHKLVRRKSISTNMLRTVNRSSWNSTGSNLENQVVSMLSTADRLGSIDDATSYIDSRHSSDASLNMQTLAQIMTNRKSMHFGIDAQHLDPLTEQEEDDHYNPSSDNLAGAVSAGDKDGGESQSEDENPEDKIDRLANIASKLVRSSDKIWLNDYMRENNNEVRLNLHRRQPWYQYVRHHPMSTTMRLFRNNWIRDTAASRENDKDEEEQPEENIVDEDEGTASDSATSLSADEQESDEDNEHIKEQGDPGSFFTLLEKQQNPDFHLKFGDVYDDYYFMRTGNSGQSFMQSTTCKVLRTLPASITKPYLTKKVLAKENYSRRVYLRLAREKLGIHLGTEPCASIDASHDEKDSDVESTYSDRHDSNDDENEQQSLQSGDAVVSNEESKPLASPPL